MSASLGSEVASSYEMLDLPGSATKAEVKEAFVRLCKQYHPDKVPPAERVVAEARFKEIKSAYDNILKHQAGYNVPPPGSAPNARYAREYYRAHGMGMDFGEGGPIRCGGPYGGFATEFDFYRSMAKTSRNNPFILIVAGLLCVPLVSVCISTLNGDTAWIRQFRDEGFHMFGQSYLRVNGKNAVGVNPFSIRTMDDIKDSYIYKDPKYAHLRKGFAASGVAEEQAQGQH